MTTESTTCPICLETIDETKNMCSTPCGHLFCFNCMVKCLKTNSTCPYCRQVIDEEAHENKNNPEVDNLSDYLLEDEEEESDYDTDDDEDDDDENDDDEDDEGCNIETIEVALKEHNISYLDIVSLLTNRFPKNTSRSIVKKMEKKLFDVISALDEEDTMQKTELALMKNEDMQFF